MTHKLFRLYQDGKWCGSPDRTITVKGKKWDLDEYAQSQGIRLPDSPKQINKKADIEVLDGDLEQEQHSDDTESSGE